MDVTKDQVIGGISTNVSAHIGHINPFRYRGYYYDEETGFYYLNTRYYDPEIRRFINMDNPELVAQLAQTPGQLNLYAYCNNNPIMYIDPTGEVAIELSLAKLLLIAVGVIAIFTVYILITNQNLDFSNVGYALDEVEYTLETIVDEIINYYSEHTKNKTKSNKGKHERGQARKKRDSRGGEKGDRRRPYQRGQTDKVLEIVFDTKYSVLKLHFEAEEFYCI